MDFIVANCVIMLLLVLAANADDRDIVYDGVSQNGVPLKTSNDLYMDPCKAGRYDDTWQ